MSIKILVCADENFSMGTVSKWSPVAEDLETALVRYLGVTTIQFIIDRGDGLLQSYIFMSAKDTTHYADRIASVLFEEFKNKMNG